MTTTSRIYTALFAALFMICSATAAYADGDGKNATGLRTMLSGAAIDGKTPKGDAEFRSNTRSQRFKVEVEHVNLPKDTQLTVLVVHSLTMTTVGFITLSGSGEGELELDTREGDTVPAVQKGDMIVVQNGALAILSGVF
jgi:hypothetical protein